MPGKLIVIDGIDGSGKQTQAQRLVQKLKNEGQNVKYFDFPQYENNFFGQMVRQYLDGKFGKPTKVHPKLASVLYAADRWESSDQLKQWLAAGKIIIVDRYYTSNLIHQGAKLPPEKLDKFINWIYELEFETFKIPKPNTVIYLHVPAEVAYNLISKRGWGHDGHDEIAFLKKSEQSCLYLTNKLGWTKIECCDNNKLLSIEEVAAKVWQVVKDILSDGRANGSD
jgi:dTMP kinase